MEAMGAAGTMGAVGATGATGDEGAMGATGAAGAMGVTGGTARHVACQYWYLALPSTAKSPMKHKSATLLKNIIECASQGAFKMVGHSKWFLFGQVAPLQSIMLLMLREIFCHYRSNILQH